METGSESALADGHSNLRANYKNTFISLHLLQYHCVQHGPNQDKQLSSTQPSSTPTSMPSRDSQDDGIRFPTTTTTATTHEAEDALAI